MTKSIWRLILLLGVLGVLSTPGVNVAQEGSVTLPKPPTTRPTRRTPIARPRPAPAREAPLTVQWCVRKKTEKVTDEPTNPTAVFHPGDLLRFTVTTNYDGYLYVVYEKEGRDGTIILPDSRVRGGQNFVKGQQEYALPAPTCDLTNPLACWYEVDKSPEREFFTLIFSRNLVLNLPEQVAFTGGVIKQPALNKLLVGTGQRVRVGSRPSTATQDDTPCGLYSIWITNTDPKDNGQIVFRIPVNKNI